MRRMLTSNTDRKHLLKYFRVFFALVIIIAMMLSFAQYAYTERVIHSDIDDNNITSFMILKKLYDMQLAQIEQSMHVLCTNPTFAYFMDYYEKQNIASQMRAINELNAIAETSNMISDICIYYPSHKYALSYKQSVSTLEMRHDSEFLLSLKELPPSSEYRTFVRTVTYPFAKQSTTVVTLVKVLSIRSGAQKADAYIVVDLLFDHIYEDFRDHIAQNDLSLLIYTGDGTLLCSVGQSYPYEALTDGGEITESMRSEVRKIDGIDYRVYSTGIPALRWMFFYVQNNIATTTRLTSARNAVIAVFLVCVLIGLVYSWFLSRHLLKPLASLSAQLGNNTVDIYERIDLMIAQNEAMHNSLQKNLIASRNNQMLLRLLVGVSGDQAEQPLNLRNGETECAFYLFKSYVETQVNEDEINRTLAPFGMRLLVRLQMGVHTVALLIAARAFDETNTVESAKRLKKMLGDEDVSVGISHPFASSADLNAAYAEANVALDMRVVRGDGIICTFDEIRGNTSIVPYKIENGLLRAFKAGNKTAMEDNMHKFEQYLRDTDATLQSVHENYVQLFCSCQQLAIDMAAGGADLESGFSYCELTSMKSLQEMSAYIIAFMESLLEACAPAESKSKVIARVCAYIDEHLADQLAIVVLAEKFFMSPTTLRNDFSKSMGMSIKAYTDLRRVQMAKELLTNTDMKINDIAVKIGFCYGQSFTPFFKNATGSTPNEYRREKRRQMILEEGETAQPEAQNET